MSEPRPDDVLSREEFADALGDMETNSGTLVERGERALRGHDAALRALIGELAGALEWCRDNWKLDPTNVVNAALARVQEAGV